jgi:hypothetical protein
MRITTYIELDATNGREMRADVKSMSNRWPSRLALQKMRNNIGFDIV